jgi:hypothetical protein
MWMSLMRMRMTCLLLVLLAFLANTASSARAQPAAEMEAALVAAQAAPGRLYLTLYNIPPDLRPRMEAVVSYVLNATSDVGVLTRPIWVSKTLLSFDPQSLCSSPERLQEWLRGWEAAGTLDYSWGFTTQVQVEGQELATKRVPGGWLDLKTVAELQSITGRGQAVLRADQFVAVASSTIDGGQYYQLTGIPDTKDAWFTSHGVHLETVNRVRAKRGANLINSAITFKPRRVFRLQGSLGGSYFTLDSAQVTASGDPLRYPVQPDGTLTLPHDAGEFIAVQANGLLRFALYGEAGGRQNAVPQGIAIDPQDPQGVLQPLVSCVRCHVEAGLRPLEGDQASLAMRGVSLLSSDPQIIQRAQEFYSPPQLVRSMDFDRGTYTAAVLALTGLAPADLAESLAQVYREYRYNRVNQGVAAGELGLEPEQAAAVLSKSSDPIILAIVAGEAVHRDQWASSFHEAALLAAGNAQQQEQQLSHLLFGRPGIPPQPVVLSAR